MAEHIEQPLFRAKKLTSIGGIRFDKGQLSDGRNSWLAGDAWEQLNESARRLFRYAELYGSSKFFPPYPAAFDGVTRRHYLPADITLGRFWRNGNLVDVPAPPWQEPEGPNVPRYIASGQVRLRDRVIDGTKPFVSLSWPHKRWKAASQAGAQIIAWMAANREHPDFESIPSPFNLFDMKPWLPKLPEQKSAYPPPPTFTYERSRGHVVKQADGTTRIATIDATGGFDA